MKVNKPKTMWTITTDGIGLIAGTLAYTRQAAYQLIAGRERWTAAECRHNGYRAIKIIIAPVKP